MYWPFGSSGSPSWVQSQEGLPGTFLAFPGQEGARKTFLTCQSQEGAMKASHSRKDPGKATSRLLRTAIPGSKRLEGSRNFSIVWFLQPVFVCRLEWPYIAILIKKPYSDPPFDAISIAIKTCVSDYQSKYDSPTSTI